MIVCHAVTGVPDLLITPHQGIVCIITFDNPFAGLSFGSVNGKLPVKNVYVVLSKAMIVLLAPDGASLMLFTVKLNERPVFNNPSDAVT